MAYALAYAKTLSSVASWMRPWIAYLEGIGRIERTMATGWAPDSAVTDQIEDTVTDGVLNARARLPVGDGTTHCVECGEEIPEARRRALPGAHTCIDCQSGRDERVVHSAINRRGSKDSQLR